MPKTDFKKLFKDKDKYPDGITLQLGDAQVTLGDLREYDNTIGGELQSELNRQMEALKLDQGKVQAASERVAQMFIDLETQKKALGTHTPTATTANDPLARYESDEVFGPLVKSFRTELATKDKAITDMSAKMDNIAKSIAQMGTTYMGDKARMDFETISKDDPVRPKDLSLDSLYKYAVEQRIYDRNNLPDMRTAYDRLTGDARHKHEVEVARAQERAKVLAEQAESAMLPRPMGGLPPVPDGYKPPVNINDAFSKASSDKDLWKSVQEASLQ